MDFTFNQIISFFKHNQAEGLETGNWGIERETHRINSDGSIALTPHPKVLATKKASQSITLDFAESQLEFMTKPHDKIEKVIDELNKIYDFTKKQINDELMWPFSMPPVLPDEEDIPIARFPHLADGQDKETYREGLSVRYGKKIQMISGIHYNYSFSDQLIDQLHQAMAPEQSRQAFINQLYMKISRNVLTYRWLITYLFGASPVVDQSYRSVFNEKMQACQSEWFSQTFDIKEIDRYATSLRTSRFGYSTAIEDKYHISYNSLTEHINDLRHVLSIDNPKYEKIGVNKNGRRIQLNTKELQSEAEFYAPIRFRQVQKEDETLLDALEQRGIQYFELRLLDLNPFDKLAITKEQLQFIHLFVLYCLFEESNELTEIQQMNANQNQQLVALLGRKPNLTLINQLGENVLLEKWALEIIEKIDRIACLLDEAIGTDKYMPIVCQMKGNIENPSLILSQQMVNEMTNANQTFAEYGIHLAKQYQLQDTKLKRVSKV